LTLFASALLPHSALANDALIQRFVAEAPIAWEKYDAFVCNLEGQITRNSFGEYLAKMTFKQDGPRKLFVIEQLKAPEPIAAGRGRQARVSNDNYVFTLAGNAGERNWAITALESRGNSEVCRRHFVELDNVFRNLRCLIQLEGVGLPELVKRSSFRVLSAQPLTDEARQCISIRFENQHSPEERPFCPIQRGTVVLEPAHAWCVRQAEIETLHAENVRKIIKLENEYVASPSGFSLPVSSRKLQQRTKAGATGEYVSEDRFELREMRRRPSSHDFTLSAFGLPEPPGVRKPGVPWFVWLGGVGVLLVLAAFLVQRWRRKVA
jgi:hypothetical protein